MEFQEFYLYFIKPTLCEKSFENQEEHVDINKVKVCVTLSVQGIHFIKVVTFIIIV